MFSLAYSFQKQRHKIVITLRSTWNIFLRILSKISENHPTLCLLMPQSSISSSSSYRVILLTRTLFEYFLRILKKKMKLLFFVSPLKFFVPLSRFFYRRILIQLARNKIRRCSVLRKDTLAKKEEKDMKIWTPVLNGNNK